MRIGTAALVALVGMSAAPRACAFIPPHPAATSSAAAFQRPAGPATELGMSSSSVESSRRGVLGSALAFGAAALLGSTSLPIPARAGLLDEYGADPTKIQVQQQAEERRAVSVKPKDESVIEPNLRSNYYYPTNKKRYLPRIKRCNDAIPVAAAMIGEGDWDGAEEFAIKIADDTVLPMKLYTSSLTGGGTNVKVSFTKDMNKAAADFEKAQKKLVRGISKRDREASSTALEELSQALLSYRTSGRLLGPDGGGDIPSVDEIRRSACRVQGRSFEQKIKARDARLKESLEVTQS